MKSFSTKLALSTAGVMLFTIAAYAQTPDDAVQSSHHNAVHHRAYPHAIYNQAVPYSAPYASNGASSFGSEEQPLYGAAVLPEMDQPGVACVGGRGIGYYPNPVAYGESAATIESGGEFIEDRGYLGCFTYIGE